MYKKKYIETPDRLLEMWNEYAKFVKSNPRYKYQLSQRTSTMIAEPLEVPYTMEGFRIFCKKNFNVTVSHYFDNRDGSYDDYCTICNYIRDIIRNDQIVGGMVGQYNPSITQRLNNLVDKSQVDQDSKIEVVYVKGKSIL